MIKKITTKLRALLNGHTSIALENARRIQQISAIAVASELDRLANQEPRSLDALRLTKFERKVFSQSGEDGILREIYRRIGTTNQYFIEFGVETGLENNTACCLISGWRGLWIEASAASYAKASENYAREIDANRLKIICRAVTPDNVEELFKQGGAPEEPDLLSIDIDGNDIYVWKAITSYRPRVIVVEYNSIFPPPQRWAVVEDPNYGSSMTSHFGASLSSFCDVAADKGYVLVGCSLSGVNAFFVRKDLAHPNQFAAPFSAENHYEPPRYYLIRDWVGHPRETGPYVMK